MVMWAGARHLLLGLLLCAPTGLAWQSAVAFKGSLHPAARAALSPTLRPRAPFATRLVASALAVPEPESTGWRAKLKLPPADEMRKIVPLALMFFCILFNYTILRDTKDVLVVTAPGSSAEAIPFLKTWVNLPGAVIFTVLYSAMANRLGPQALFYAVLSPFLASSARLRGSSILCAIYFTQCSSPPT